MYIEVNQSCRLCENKLQHAFDTVVMNKYKSRVLYCLNCGLLQINNPTWLDEAYNNPTAFADTGLVMRNLSICQQLSPMLFHVFGVEGRYVDLAGGTGLLVRLMRDTGFDFYWHDPYCSNVHARGFEFAVEKGPCNAVTAFEVLEHILDPIKFVSDAIRQTQAGVFVFSTDLFEGVPPKPGEWWYYDFDIGQHISFYQKKTLHYIANKLAMNLHSFGLMHVFYSNKYTDLFASYFNSRLVRWIARLKASRSLQSKTMADHLMIIGKKKELNFNGEV